MQFIKRQSLVCMISDQREQMLVYKIKPCLRLLEERCMDMNE